ncbi:MAG: hypothetical protein J6V68_03665 [Clostridia bacterium]|nr:hypothetical protein [Clostridia bacterium]
MASFEKIIFYCYPKISKVVSVIDAEFKKQVFSSRFDYSSAYSQCQSLVKLTNAKIALLKTKKVVEDVLVSLKDLAPFVKYKYFGVKNEETAFIDSTKRSYYRIQDKIVKKLRNLLEVKGIDEKWFDENLKNLTYIKEIARRIDIREQYFKRIQLTKNFQEKPLPVKKIS